MTAPDDTPTNQPNGYDNNSNPVTYGITDGGPKATGNPTTDPYTGQDMRFGGDRAGSLEAILNKYASEYRAWMNLKSDEKPGLQEALAAIAAYYEGLLPEKQQTSVYDSEARRLQAKGHNAAIDTIRRNFKGDSNG